MVECTLPITEEGASTTNPIFVSNFNTSASTYEISWRDFDVMWSERGSNFFVPKTIDAGTFIMEKSQVGASAAIIFIIASVDNEPYLMWTAGAVATIADTFTNTRQITSGIPGSTGTEIQRFTKPDFYPFTNSGRVIAYVNDGIYHIRPDYDIVGTTVRCNANTNFTNVASTLTSWTITHPFNDGLIVGWTQSTDTLTSDTYANRGSYDDYRRILDITTDSSGNFKGGFFYNENWDMFGETGLRVFVDAGGTTHSVKMVNGRVVYWTTT